jgi:hypothetical protein
MQIITEQINLYIKHLKPWISMINFAENILISLIKLMFHLKFAKEFHSYIKLNENDTHFLNKIYFLSLL